VGGALGRRRAGRPPAADAPLEARCPAAQQQPRASGQAASARLTWPAPPTRAR
jgi:hypothetical protein